ncbi:xanthine dehydrogenase family protein molybdopterin-binding subunit [candidate division KSB1 bacterium]
MAKNEEFPKRVKTTYIGEGTPITVEVEVPRREAKPYSPQDDLRYIGKAHTRLEGPDKVSGSAKYVSDIELPGMLYAKLFRSEKANANITNIDVSRARAMRGVREVMILNSERVRYVGETIGILAAESEQIAEDAVREVSVEYEELPFVVSINRAMAEGAPDAMDRGSNIAPGRPTERGNVEEGFNQADAVIEAQYRTQVEIHHPIEPHATIVHWEGDFLTVYDGTQTVTPNKQAMARFLQRDFPEWNITENRIRILCEHVGGAFGSKIGFNNHVYPQVRLARALNVPIKMVLDRFEQSVDAGNRPNSIQSYKIGARSDGTLTAIEMEGFGSGGVSRNDGLTIAATDMYRCPNVNAVSHSVYMNTGPRKAFRGPGHVQCFVGFDAAIDELAHELRMDPLELRRKNFTDRSEGGTGLPYSSNSLMRCYELGAEAIEWGRRNREPGAGSGRLKRGIGMSAALWSGVGGPNTLIELDIFRDGSVNVRTGTQEIGTGTRTIMAQVTAEDLGLETSEVNVQIGDSNYPEGSPSYGSINASSVCPAVRNACLDAKRKLYPVAAGRLNVQPEELDDRAGRIFVRGDESRGMTVKEAARLLSEDKVMGTGRRRPNPEDYAGNTFGAHFSEVEVDTVTGKVRAIKHVAAHDSGKIINPLTFGNQVIGAVNQAISWVLFEGRIMDDRTGRMTNTNLHDYKMIPAPEAPEIVVLYTDVPDDLQNNIGCKGVGEPPRITAPASITNAIFNAAGIRMRDLPITPDKVLAALNREGRS